MATASKASSSATWIAFAAFAKRGLTTITPTRRCPRQPSFLPPHHTIVSKATKGRKLPKNHFTSNPQRHAEAQSQPTTHEPTKQQKQHKEKGPKRKAAQRAQAPSLRRVAVEAQRSRGSLIRGSGKTRHVDPEAETKDVIAYCAAETYNVHVARDLLRQRGWKDDVWGTGMFPQVLHVRIPVTGEKLLGRGPEEAGEQGDVFVFPSGSVVTWNVPDRVARHLVEKVLLLAAENSHIATLEAEDLEYIEDSTRPTSEIIGDTILLGTKPNPDHDAELPYPETDTTLTQIAFSSALARSTKLAVLESRLAAHIQTTISIPLKLSQGSKPSMTRTFVLRKTGELLTLRAHLNLYSELTDDLPDLFWDSPHELGLETIYDSVGKELDVEARITILNGRLDYASEIAAVLRERLSEQHSHLLEWIIIWLIVIEVVYGSLHLWRERRERIEPDSDRNLMRAWLERELGRN